MIVWSRLLAEPWIFDVDTTIKPLYGHQEGAVLGYNPKKPGRPSHCYHTYSMASTVSFSMSTSVPATKHASRHSAPSLWALLDRLPRDLWPALLRGDRGFGNEEIMREAEARALPFLLKLRLTANVKRMIEKLAPSREWVDAGQGFEAKENCTTSGPCSWAIALISRVARLGVPLARPLENLFAAYDAVLKGGLLVPRDLHEKFYYLGAVLLGNRPDFSGRAVNGALCASAPSFAWSCSALAHFFTTLVNIFAATSQTPQSRAAYDHSPTGVIAHGLGTLVRGIGRSLPRRLTCRTICNSTACQIGGPSCRLPQVIDRHRDLEGREGSSSAEVTL